MKKLNTYLLISFFWLASSPVKAQIRQGYDAPEIALPTVTGDTIRLSSLKGKVVLLDFWASWCGPCRSSNKQLVKLYPKYKAKGFEIFGVSLDDDKNKWKNAIQKDKINWLQVNDGGGWDAPTAVTWNISAIPTSYLIDQTGKLIAMDLEGKYLEKALKDLLGK
jgi:peroxiredoxin